MEKNNPKDEPSYMQLLGVGMSLVTEFCVACAVGWYLGSKADEKFGTGPWLMIIGIVVFLSASLFHMLHFLKFLDKRDK